MPVRQKLANGNGAFTAALVSLLIIAAVIAVLIILTVKNRGTGDEETAEPNADENKSAAENANQPASADSPK
jgi:large-conductance mechanosensitive channel